MLFNFSLITVRVTPSNEANIVEVELEETKAIPWSPQFDQTDDLGGVLRPKGRLLSLAFNFDDTQSSPRPQIDNTFTDGIQREPFDENDIP